MLIQKVSVMLGLVALQGYLAAGSSLKSLRSSYKEWSSSTHLEAKSAASKRAIEMAAKLDGQNLKDLISADTLDRLRTPLSEQGSSWQGATSQKIKLGHLDGNNRVAGSRISSPFFEAALPGVPMDQVAQTIHDMMTEELRLIVTSANPDASGLLQAMLLVGIDATDLNVPEVMVLVAHVLAEFDAALNPVPEYLEDYSVAEGTGEPIRYHDIIQDNYAKTLGSTQHVRTYYPLTRQGIVNIVKKARREQARVRASGLKHSWNHWLWGVDNQHEEVFNPCYRPRQTGDVDYFIAMVPYELSDSLFHVRADIEGWRAKASELTSIEGPIDIWTDDDGSEHASVKVGAATLSMFLTQWSLENGWMLPAEPMTPLFTLGGVVSTSSHGSGRRFPPVSQQVIAMEYVDEKGDIQYVDDPEELAATTASYGLFGIIISLTFKLNRVGHVTFLNRPVQTTLEEYIPRANNPFPPEMLDKLENYYYQTMFQFPDFELPPTGFPQVLEIFFKEDGNSSEAIPLVSPGQNIVEISLRFLQRTIHNIIHDALEDTGTETYLYWLYMLVERQVEGFFLQSIPAPQPVVTSTAEALHWIRGLHNYDIIRNMEVNVPIRDDGNGNPDWTTVQEVFWLYNDVVDSYERYGILPHDVATEMRFVGGSNQILDAYYDSPHGTFAVDISCSNLVPLEVWNQFKNDIAFRFSRFNTGGLRKPRYHLAKEIPINVSGKTSVEYFLESYGDQVDLFKEKYKTIVKSRGSSMRRSLQRFSTKFFDRVLLDCREPRPDRCYRKPWFGNP